MTNNWGRMPKWVVEAFNSKLRCWNSAMGRNKSMLLSDASDLPILLSSTNWQNLFCPISQRNEFS